MKKRISIFLIMAFSVMLVFISSYADGIAEVTTQEELEEALYNDDVKSIIVSTDMEITLPYVDITKEVTITADVVFHPAADDGFFVKSIIIEEGGILKVTGKLTTMHTFDNGFAIANVTIEGGTFDVSEGAVSDDFNLCFNRGILVEPKCGFGPDVAVERYIYENVTEETIAEALDVEGLRTIIVQDYCEIAEELTVPEDKSLEFDAIAVLKDGAGIAGNVIASEGNGFLLEGTAYINDIISSDPEKGCLVLTTEENYCLYNIISIQEWIDAKGENGDCAFIATVEELPNPAFAVVSDGGTSAGLFGIICGEAMSVYDAGIEEGDILVLVNPKFNVYEGNIEMEEPVLVCIIRSKD